MSLLALFLLAHACQPQGNPSSPPPADVRRLRIGESVAAVLGPTDPQLAGHGPSRRFELGLEEGPVTISLESYDFDVFLRIESEAGELLAEDDDSGVETDARVVVAQGRSACYIVVSSKEVGGEFVLTVQAGDVPLAAGAALADAGIAWRSTAAERALARGDKKAAAMHRMEEGRQRYGRSQYHEAKTAFESSLALNRDLGDAGGEALALTGVGRSCLSLGDPVHAGESLERAHALASELGTRDVEAKVLRSLGWFYQSKGDSLRAREHAERSLTLARELGDRVQDAAALINLGNAYNSLSDYPRARKNYEEGLDIARQVGQRQFEANALANLSKIYLSLGKYSRAQDTAEQHLALARELGDQAGEAIALINLGRLYTDLGDYPRAREHCEKGLDIARRVGHRQLEAWALTRQGSLYCNLGDYPQALEKLEQSLTLQRELGNRAGEAEALIQLGRVHTDLADYPQAKELLGQHLVLAREIGDRAGEAAALIDLGGVHTELGDYPQALPQIEQGLNILRQMGRRQWEVSALVDLGHVHCHLGDYSRAREIAGTGEALARELGARVELISILNTLARASLGIHDSRRALDALEEAERLLDEVLAADLELGEVSGVRGRFAGLGTTAQTLAVLRLSEAGEDPAARAAVLRWGFDRAGRWKGRARLEGIAEHRSGARSAEVIEVRRARLEALASNGAILERVSNAIHDEKPPEEVDALRSEAEAKLAEARRLASKLREVSPRDAALDLPFGVSPEEVRGVVLGPHELLVEYAEGEKHLYAYVLGKEVLEFIDLGPTEEIAAELECFLGGISGLGRPASPDEVGRAGHALFERLLAPALAKTKQPVEGLVIVPSAALATLPFEALVLEKASDSSASFAELMFVLERYEVTYGPSSPVLVELAGIEARSSPGKLLLLADPLYGSEGDHEAAEPPVLVAAASSRARPETEELTRLPGTRAEAFAIANLLTAENDASLADLRERRSGSLARERFELHMGGAASKARLAGDLRGYSALHFACHGFVDAEFPQQTGIALSTTPGDEGWFTILDALELDLNADLVVLSACETSRGQAKAGEGVESLARAFLYAGARGLVASLWQVEDRSAARTMEAFYAGWLQRGIAPARALREAKLALRRGQLELGPARGVSVDGSGRAEPSRLDSGHPFFWAPFIHVGLSAVAAR